MTARVVNICFHGVGVPRRPLEPGESGYWIDVDTFHRMLDLVVGRNDVRLSFDDGNISDLDVGLPALVERGLDATFFALAGRLGTSGSLGGDDLRTLREHGMRIGSHGMDHVPWRGLRLADTGRELVTAREILAGESGGPVDEAAAPLGRYDRQLLQRLRRLGYRAVHTSDRRWAVEGGWLQPRFSVLSDETVDSLKERALRRPSLSRRVERGAVGILKRVR